MSIYARIAAAVLSVAFLSASLPSEAIAAPENERVSLPVTSRSGLSSSKLEALDRIMLKVMKSNGIYAGQLAVAKHGQLVYSKAFGFSDKERKVDTSCDTLFRIASSSKPITAVAIMTLVQQGKLKVDDKALDILKDYKPAAGEPFDPKLQTVTVRQLLEHTAGFSNAKGDPQFEYLRLAAQKYSLPQPASAQAIVRYRLTKPLDRDPATQYEYSNFGYNMLGRIIEKVSGEDYETYVKKNVLNPAGASNMVLGHTRLVEMSPKEVFYDDLGNSDSGTDNRGWSVYAAEPEQVAASYGSSFSQEAMDAHGGWLATAEDLTKFIAAADGSNSTCKLLNPETISLMVAPPEVAQGQPGEKGEQGKKKKNRSGSYYAKGWNFDPKSGQWAHSGALTFGTASFVCHLADGVQVAAVFNHLPTDYGKFFEAMQPKIVNAVEKRKSKI
ncbi:MAG: serine hydrolase domain-containing protein [Candidatus Melainabacteria bacterium]|nr:serine hydrolase domain-containing protein [Candidatus Melainabacteria bacterium]